MKKYFYEIRIKDGRSNENWQQWYDNVKREFDAIETDYGGISEICAVSSHHDAETVWMLSTSDFASELARKDVEVAEITKATVSNRNHRHSSYENVVKHFKSKRRRK